MKNAEAFSSNDKILTPLKTLQELIRFVIPKGNKEMPTRIILALIFLSLATLVSVYTPFLYGKAVDLVAEGKLVDLNLLWLVIGSYALARLGQVFFDEAKEFVFARVAQRAVRGAALKAFKHMHSLSLTFHLNRQTGGLTRAIDRGAKGIEFLLRFTAFEIVPVIVELFTVGIVLWVTFGFVYAAVTVSTVLVYIVYTIKVTEWRIAIRRKMNIADENASTKAIDSLLNYETVKYFNAEIVEAERFDAAMKLYEDSAVKARASLSIVNIGQGGIIALGLFIIMGMAGEDIASEKMSIGDFVVVNTFLLQLYLPLNFLGFVYREIRQSLLDMGRMFALVDEKPDIIDKQKAYNLNVHSGKIEFKNISFSYGNRKILKDLSFVVNPGHKVAIVGPTGAGKSTISKLIFRFYDPSSGNIFIDDQCLRDVTQSSLRSNIGVVPQDTVMFNDTIKYNISYSKPGSSMTEIENVAKLSSIDKFIADLELGYETVVGERGLKLSGGEKQRVAIARALLKNPKIFIFDEATSALDTKTEKLIEKSLKKLSNKNTTLVIAHRLSTVIDANKIIVLEKGKIAEQGTHKELLQKNGLYAEMWMRQQEQSD
ncbi:MAG: ABC transporter ATP-binding protein/permease [Alphaproteobacteria bacterium]|jgi:ATP-binding cassette subfamily B protein|nr:ABC transporter ATP-binding protein/permease [Alphaproteobacteria bacterium]MDG1467279.1 ABC transporter ATP-binding protein/permease [Alphaproteobacteria bacterium]MDG1882129.1 ABC transporter ATP-binding protein/permease [Alphaproteobacteria bacterium]MDG1982784.1 ABC transporter ATP-binding protein/permease [Alphaproteobacteria bacterium]MDG2458804.1 ABC transporter ATP-binding protein/permease [Alphaproteobacteria bacterium]